MFRVLACLLAFFLVGCATGIAEIKEAADCPVVGVVSGNFDIVPGYAILGHAIGKWEARRKALLQAEKLGATHVQWTELRSKYLCEMARGGLRTAVSSSRLPPLQPPALKLPSDIEIGSPWRRSML